MFLYVFSAILLVTLQYNKLESGSILKDFQDLEDFLAFVHVSSILVFVVERIGAC